MISACTFRLGFALAVGLNELGLQLTIILIINYSVEYFFDQLDFS